MIGCSKLASIPKTVTFVDEVVRYAGPFNLMEILGRTIVVAVEDNYPNEFCTPWIFTFTYKPLIDLNLIEQTSPNQSCPLS